MFISHHCSKATNYFNTHQIGGSCHRALASSNHILARKDSPKKEVQVNDFSLNKHLGQAAGGNLLEKCERVRTPCKEYSMFRWLRSENNNY